MSTTPNQKAARLSPPPAPARRPALLAAVAAGLCWACALAALLSAGLDAEQPLLAPARVIFYALVLAAGLLTFVPFQRRLGLPGLALEGVAGSFLLLYTLAFVPPPTGWLLALPEQAGPRDRRAGRALRRPGRAARADAGAGRLAGTDPCDRRAALFVVCGNRERDKMTR